MGKFFTPAHNAPALAPPVSMPVALPAVKIIFPIAPEKPPLPQEAALKILNTLDFGALKQFTSLVNHQDSQFVAVPLRNPVVNFSKRPLQRLTFSARPVVHHSIFVYLFGATSICMLQQRNPSCHHTVRRNFNFYHLHDFGAQYLAKV